MDMSVGGQFEAGHHAQRGRLAATAGPEKGNQFAFFDIEIKILTASVVFRPNFLLTLLICKNAMMSSLD
jgi:hypothetical protein